MHQRLRVGILGDSESRDERKPGGFFRFGDFPEQSNFSAQIFGVFLVNGEVFD